MWPMKGTSSCLSPALFLFRGFSHDSGPRSRMHEDLGHGQLATQRVLPMPTIKKSSAITSTPFSPST